MRTIPLSGGIAEALVDDDDYERLAAFRWQLVVKRSGRYVRRHHRIGKGAYGKRYMHHEVLGDGRVDHVNGDGLDNQRSNLRFATRQENARNSRRRETWMGQPRTRFKGTWRDSRRAGSGWFAQIRLTPDAPPRRIGPFDDEEAAARAYDAAARQHFGAFARTNFGA